MRLIDADKLDSYVKDKLCGNRAEYELFATMIDNQPTAKAWVPISERLPALGMCVICTVKDHFRNQYELRYPVYYLQKTYEPGYAFYFGDTSNPLLPDISEVIAWMPLPETFKDEQYE
ncbi:MAG: DUF551 domain-containing protein [Anaerocolumna sp.]